MTEGKVAGPAGPSPRVAVVLPGDEVPMPGEKRVRCHKSSDLGQHAPADLLGLGGQADPLIVGESHSPVPELLA